MTRILAIDTATEACSAALWQDGQVLTRYQVAPRGHTDLVLPMVAELLAESQLTLTELDALAFGRGPGSFTGVRITLGIAQGLAFGGDLPLLGVSNLQALAQGAYRLTNTEQVVAAIDARMQEIYVGHYQLTDGIMQPVVAEQVISPQAWLDAHNTVVNLGVGSGFVTYPNLTERVAGVCDDLPYPEAQDMLAHANALYAAGLGVSAAQAQPVYLRDTVTWQKLPGR